MKQSLKEVLQNSCSWGPVAKFKEKTDAATRGVLYKKVFLKIHRKTPVPESLF